MINTIYNLQYDIHFLNCLHFSGRHSSSGKIRAETVQGGRWQQLLWTANCGQSEGIWACGTCHTHFTGKNHTPSFPGQFFPGILEKY